MKRGLIFGFLVISSISFASLQESLPSWHWSYSLIEQLQLRGGFLGLVQMNSPYTRGDVAQALIDLRKEMESGKPFDSAQGKLELSPSDEKQFVRLVQEFKEEILELTGKEEASQSLKFGTRLQEDVFKSPDEKTKAKGIYRFLIGADLNEHIGVYNTMNLDQYKVNDPLYIGKKWRGVVGFTEQAYASAIFGKFRLKFGRDFLRWGVGQSGTLLFSDVCRPLDQLAGSFNLGPFQFSFLTATLDDISLSQEWADSLGYGKVTRYISAHRANLSLADGRLQLAVSEGILYGGVHHSLDWVYVNPFMIYHAAQMNQKDQVNTLGTIEALWYPTLRLQVYGVFLLDDIQVERTGPGDLEPNEVGWQFGGRWADPFMIQGFTLSTEFTRVTNRTYKTPTPWETYIFRNDPLGHPLGDDFDTWQIGADQWMGASLHFNITYSRTRKGEGSIYTPWDAPWFDYPVDEGYKEPYLTGTVETRQAFQFSFGYFPSTNWGIEGNFQNMNRKNAYHIAGENKTETFWKIGVWFLGEVKYPFYGER